MQPGDLEKAGKLTARSRVRSRATDRPLPNYYLRLALASPTTMKTNDTTRMMAANIAVANTEITRSEVSNMRGNAILVTHLFSVIFK